MNRNKRVRCNFFRYASLNHSSRQLSFGNSYRHVTFVDWRVVVYIAGLRRMQPQAVIDVNLKYFERIIAGGFAQRFQLCEPFSNRTGVISLLGFDSLYINDHAPDQPRLGELWRFESA